MREKATQVYYCGTCLVYMRPTGGFVSYESDDVVVWTECPPCLLGRLEREAKAGASRALDDERTRPRVCELDGCDEVFAPRPPWKQRYCRPEHRWLAARARRRLLAEAG